MPVRKSKVLWVDCENGLGQVGEMVKTISTKFLGLPDVPEDLIMWNLNDSEGDTVEELLQEFRPDSAIIDTLRTMFPEMERKNWDASQQVKEFRLKYMSPYRCAITGVHHIRKPNEEVINPKDRLETTEDLAEWFNKASGARALINQSDVRYGIEKGVTKGTKCFRGFERVRGKTPTWLLVEVADEETGEPIGFRELTGWDAVSEDDQKFFKTLPDKFRFKDAKLLFKSLFGTDRDQTVLDALNRLVYQAKVLRKLDGKKGYEKAVAAVVRPKNWTRQKNSWVSSGSGSLPSE
jgi:hypothetical protein